MKLGVIGLKEIYYNLFICRCCFMSGSYLEVFFQTIPLLALNIVRDNVCPQLSLCQGHSIH